MHLRGSVGRSLIALALVASLLTACSSSSSKGASSSPSTTTPFSTALGTGVTANSIKVGVMMTDYSCVEQYIHQTETQQQSDFDIYFNDINAHGGINGRILKPVYEKYCPPQLQPTQELNDCTKLTDDEHVFAAIGDFYDPNGNAQLCFIKQHHTPIVADSLTDALVARGPAGYMVASDIAPERRLNVILSLLQKDNILAGKTVGTVTTAANRTRVTKIVDPALQQLGVKRGTDAVLSITSGDLNNANSQLDAAIEKWRIDHTNALFMIGEDVSSQNFIDRIKQAIPSMQLISDTTSVGDGGQTEQQQHQGPNNYDGIISAEGQTGLEHSKTPHYTYCANIWTAAMHKPAPLPNVIVKLPNGDQDLQYGAMEEACNFVTMFAEIARRVGPYLNNDNWARTVNNYGPIEDMQTIYASIHAGKYDADDTYSLVRFDPTIPPDGDWVHITPVQNVGDTSAG